MGHCFQWLGFANVLLFVYFMNMPKAVKITFTVRDLTVCCRDFSYNGENGYVFSNRGLNGGFSATHFH